MKLVERDATSADVLKRLAEPSFNALLTATAEDGSRPIIVALRSDSFRDVLTDVKSYGGCANIVVPFFNGYMVMAFHLASKNDRQSVDTIQTLSADMTMGVLIAGVAQDGEEGQDLRYCVDLSNGAVPGSRKKSPTGATAGIMAGIAS